jgi:hypothetical protein
LLPHSPSHHIPTLGWLGHGKTRLGKLTVSFTNDK